MIKGLTQNRKVLHKYLYVLLKHVREDDKHAPFESSRRITQTERHPPKCEHTKWENESCLLLILYKHRNLVVPKIPIQKAIKGLSR